MAGGPAQRLRSSPWPRESSPNQDCTVGAHATIWLVRTTHDAIIGIGAIEGTTVPRGARSITTHDPSRRRPRLEAIGGHCVQLTDRGGAAGLAALERWEPSVASSASESHMMPGLPCPVATGARSTSSTLHLSFCWASIQGPMLHLCAAHLGQPLSPVVSPRRCRPNVIAPVLGP